MARPRQSAGPLSPGQASYVIERLIRDRRISSGEVSRYVSEMRNEISELEQQLARLRAAHGGESGGSSASGAPARGGARRGRPPGSGKRAAAAPTGRRRGRPSKAAAASGDQSSSGESAAAPAGRRRRRQSAITPEQLQSRQLQGRYLALVRRFPANKRAQYARIAKEQGREAAIKEMSGLLKK